MNGTLNGGDDWSRTSSAFRAADLQSTGVTNFPTSPLIESSTLYAYPQHALLELTVY
jgi:hypothetical protein